MVAGAAPPPWLRVVSLTLMGAPAPAMPGTVSALGTRSGPMVSARDSVLLDSEVSTRASSPSALAMRYQEPVVVPAGMVTLTEPELAAPGASAATARLPMGTSPASSVELLER